MSDEKARGLLGEHIRKYDRAYLKFSGGKESVVLADMCREWRDKVSLVWFNPGVFAAHMEVFVRGYAETFNLIEVSTPDPRDLWAIQGTPSEVLPYANRLEGHSHQMFDFEQCCLRSKFLPALEFSKAHPSDLHISGIRQEDNVAYERLDLEVTACPDTGCPVVNPLWCWSWQDILTYVFERNITLPEQYSAGLLSSLDCYGCPVFVTPERMRFLDSHYPETAASVRELNRANLMASEAATAQMKIAMGADNGRVFITPF